jgi:hypothetical protein
MCGVIHLIDPEDDDAGDHRNNYFELNIDMADHLRRF